MREKILHLFPELFGKEKSNIINMDGNATLTHEDTALILLAFLRRTILDASGDQPIDNFLTMDDKRQARNYLTIGYVKKYGYHYYDDTNIKYTPKRNHENMAEKYQPTPNQAQYSPIPLNHILDYFNVDHQSFNMYISNWKDDNWCNQNEWFVNFTKQTDIF